MAVLPTGFGKSLPFGKSITNDKTIVCCPLLNIQVIALMEDQVEGMSKIPDKKTAYAGY
jgi:superfamily II DNA helicase RecQ